jgi:hypothetical protein
MAEEIEQLITCDINCSDVLLYWFEVRHGGVEGQE